MQRRFQREGGIIKHDSVIKNLLILEDLPQITELYKRMIEDFVPLRIGKVHFALTGDEALHLAAETRMDAYCVDRDVPGVRGEDFVRIMRRLNPLAPVIIASGEYQERSLGEDIYLMKPFQLQDYSGALVSADAMVRERSQWSEAQVVDFMERTKDSSGRVDEEIIKLSDWPPGKVEEYLRAFRGRGFDPILSFSPAGFVAMINQQGEVLVNLYDTTYHTRSGIPRRIGQPYDRLLGAADYVSAHELMHRYRALGFMVRPQPDLSVYPPLSAWAFELSGRGREISEMFDEIAVESAVSQYAGPSVLSPGYASFVAGDLDLYQKTGGLTLPQLAKTRVACSRQSNVRGVGGDVSERLRALSDDAEGLMDAQISSEGERAPEVRRFCDRLVGDLNAVFDGTRLDLDRVRAFESGRGSGGRGLV